MVITYSKIRVGTARIHLQNNVQKHTLYLIKNSVCQLWAKQKHTALLTWLARKLLYWVGYHNYISEIRAFWINVQGAEEGEFGPPPPKNVYPKNDSKWHKIHFESFLGGGGGKLRFRTL